MMEPVDLNNVLDPHNAALNFITRLLQMEWEYRVYGKLSQATLDWCMTFNHMPPAMCPALLHSYSTHMASCSCQVVWDMFVQAEARALGDA
jgi:hypothetical protein